MEIKNDSQGSIERWTTRKQEVADNTAREH